MTDDDPFINRLPDGTIDTSNDLIVRDEHGDPVQDTGTRMMEKESYERVIAGLRIAAEACAHLSRIESEHAGYWNKYHRMLDGARRIAVSHAGIEDAATTKETAEVWGRTMDWGDARSRFKEGMRQAAGGMRQLASCFRLDLYWSRMAFDLESIVSKLDRVTTNTARVAQNRGQLWVPDSYLKN